MRNNKYALILALGLAFTSSAAKAQSEDLDNAQITDKKVIHLMKAIDAGAQADWIPWAKKKYEISDEFIKRTNLFMKKINPESKDDLEDMISYFSNYSKTMCRFVKDKYFESNDHGRSEQIQCETTLVRDLIETYNEFVVDQEK